MALDPVHAALIASYIDDPAAIRVIGWSICYPNRSPFAADTALDVQSGETLTDAANRLGIPWSPRWLLDAGYATTDSAGNPVSDTTPATHTGPVTWTPTVHLARVDDQVKNSVAVGSTQRNRRLSGEVAVLAMLEHERQAVGLIDMRPADDLEGNTRGATFRDFLIEVLRCALPDDWNVRHEVPLTEIRGLHMRRNVGGRSSDIIVTDDGNRLVAVISSKWTWRSDRGTEAAQMVPLRTYRPDVPYSLVTAEFARVKVIARESIEDSVYHLAPQWAGAWSSVNRSKHPRDEMPTLGDLFDEGQSVAESMGLEGLDSLIDALRASGTIL